jgi:4'-phosphopantetheinyl transferase
MSFRKDIRSLCTTQFHGDLCRYDRHHSVVADVWVQDLLQVDHGRAEALGDVWFDAHERVRRDSFLCLQARRQFTATHVLLRKILGDQMGLSPEEVCLHRSAQGRLHLVSCNPSNIALDISISHTSEYVMVAIIEDTKIGIDVEMLTARNINPSMPLFGLQAAFGVHEQSSLLELSKSARWDEVIRLWTLKEAVAKAVGLGLALPLKRAQFIHDEGRTFYLDGDKATWSFLNLRNGLNAWLSVAIPIANAGVRLTQLCGLAEEPLSTADQCGRILNTTPTGADQSGMGVLARCIVPRSSGTVLRKIAPACPAIVSK